MKRPVLGNTVVLALFCGVWYWGFYMSERWMRLLDSGLPWSWFGALFAASYVVSFLSLRQRPKAAIEAFVGPVITQPVFWLWAVLCAINFDPCP